MPLHYQDKDISIAIPNSIGLICLRKANIIKLKPNSDARKTSIDILKHDLEYFKQWTKDGRLPMVSDKTLKEMTGSERTYIQEQLPVFCSKTAILLDNGISTFYFNIM